MIVPQKKFNKYLYLHESYRKIGTNDFVSKPLLAQWKEGDHATQIRLTIVIQELLNA